MGKRKLVPAALHSELTEYSSLLRALRASNSLDVTSHLAKASFDRNLSNDPDDNDSQEENSQHETADAENEYDTDAMTNDHPTSSALPSRDVTPYRSSSPIEGSPSSQTRKRKRQSSSPPLQRRRDAWTRWPLLVGDIHVPEWSLEDEIGYLAEHILKHQSRALPPPRETGKDDKNHDGLDSEDIDDVDPSYLPHLTEATSNYLSTILALLVAHTPNRPDSLQNRVEPMGWRAVLGVLSSCGDPNVADPKMLSSVEKRMESLYSTHETTEEPDSDRIGRSHPNKRPNRETKFQSIFALVRDEPLGHLIKEGLPVEVIAWYRQLRAYSLVSDHLMDGAITRRRHPVWYHTPSPAFVSSASVKCPLIRLVAINEAPMLKSAIFQLLKTHFRKESDYVNLVSIFNVIAYKTEIGELIDMITVPQNVDTESSSKPPIIPSTFQ
ncbi:hypothetical protein C0995_011480 [Termitomyces sp. Mi166|nr:hypothetical protein C0995_011480 [Termitomyces sp. Mi166\